MRYADPGQPGSKVEFKKRYQNFIGGKWREPVKGEYFENVSPVTGRPFCEVPRSNAEDVNRALDAAHAAKDAWGKTSYAQRSVMLNKIADRMEQNLELLASSNRIAKIAFTGETTPGRLIMQYASQNLIPVTLELGGKSPNVFFEDVFAKNDDFADKALEGFAMFALNQGEVCTCPSRALIQESIYDRFIESAVARVNKITQAHPLDTSTLIGAQASSEQLEKILSYIDIGKQEGAKILTGGARKTLDGELKDGYYMQPTVLRGHNKMRVFQEEIFGPVVAVTTFKDEADALALANDMLYGLGAGLWTRDGNTAHRMGRGLKAGRVWTNCYHLYPAHAAFGGYKQSGIGRENHKMMLDHYQQTKNLLVSYSPKALGFF